MEQELACEHCGRVFTQNPRRKNQKYRGDPPCQKARKAAWQRRKMATDMDYRGNQKDGNRRWTESRPDYWKQYREKHPKKAERNRLLQAVRNARRKQNKAVIAKMDASKSNIYKPLGQFYLVPLIAKMDAVKVNISQISG